MLRQSLSQKMMQKLSPQQIQLMKLLQIPTATLDQRISEELEANPALDEGDDYAEVFDLENGAEEGEEGKEGEEEEEKDPYALIRSVGKGFARILLSVKNVDMTYGRNMNTAIAGYMPSTDNFGLDYNYQYNDPNGDLQQGAGMAPGIPFILGWQPEVWSPNDVGNAYLLNQFADNGLWLYQK